MESVDEPISARTLKINSRIVGSKTAPKWGPDLINRDTLIDALQVLHDECSIDTLKQQDKRIAAFSDKYRGTIRELKKLRPNASDFDIKSTIGRGHYGEVRIVKERQTGDVYAMKTVKKSDSSQISFKIERDIMAFNDSYWLTQLKYSFQDNTYLFFVMEYHPGGDLLGLLYRQGGTLPETASIFYIAEVVMALQDLHSLGYVHRDIKPDNVLLDRCGHIKLADFGSAAKLTDGSVSKGHAVGTPDYVAPEVLLSMEGKNKGYGVPCDFWSLGIVAYELTVGKTPFASPNTTTTYHRIMGHKSSSSTLKFPPDLVLSQAYVSLIKSLVTEEKSRLSLEEIKNHPLFSGLDFDSLRDQVPPYVPKVTGCEDSSNFSDVGTKKSTPSLENFKKRNQFSGKNLPFIGFSYTPNITNGFEPYDRATNAKNDLIRNLRSEIESLKRSAIIGKESEEACLNLERKLNEKTHKLSTLEDVRMKLEKDLSSSLAENLALKRTLDIERKDRSELERKALELITSAKIKWETSERQKVDALQLEIEQQGEKISELTKTNEMLRSQLGQALKQEEKRRESSVNFDKLNRKSVLGLENRLEKVATDHKVAVIQLQKELSDERVRKTKVQGELNELKQKQHEYERIRNRDKKEYEQLKIKMNETQVLVVELNRKLGELEAEGHKLDKFEEDNSKLKKDLTFKTLQIKDLEKRVSLLNSEKDELNSYKLQSERLKKELESSQKQIRDLETKLEEEKSKYNELNNRKLQVSETLEESQEIKELRSKVWRTDRDLSNAKLDKRILERELKDAQNQIKSLTDEVATLAQKMADKRKNHERAMLELSGFNEELSLEHVKLRDSLRILEERLENEKDKGEATKTALKEAKEALISKDSQLSSLSREISELRTSLDISEKDKRKALVDVDKFGQEVSQYVDEIDNLKRQNTNTQLNLEALREACTLLENQVIEYEILASNVESEKASLNSNLDKLVADLCEARSQTQDARKEINEEKSLRLLSENKVKRLTEDVVCLTNECQSYKSQCLEFKECAANLSEELGACEERVGELEVAVKASERKLQEIEGENVLLKEEIAQNLTHLGAARESNFKSKHHLQEYKDMNSALMCRLEELERTLCAKTRFYEERDLKFDSTIKQQSKLIDYLQTKIDEANTKKKSFADKLFGHSKKENLPPPPTPPPNRGDSDYQLRKQKEINRNLEEEIHRLREELLGVGNNAIKLGRHKSEIVSPRWKKNSPIHEHACDDLGAKPGNQQNADLNHLEVVLSTPGDVQVTCLVEIGANTKLIGSRQGLYVSFDDSDGNLSKVEGVDEIFNIKVLKPVHIAIMITGSRRVLISSDLNHITDLASCKLQAPQLSYKRASDLEGFHFLEVSEIDANLMICAATRQQIIVAAYDLDLSEFVTYRVMDTAKPTSCALFTELSLIVGADKFFEIDLASFDAEEFLDGSDPQIKQAMTCLKLGSVPVAILKTKDSPKEYMVCFKEVCVFVDEYGTASRRCDVILKRPPLKIDFVHSYLYSCHFDGLEILRIADDVSTISDLTLPGFEMIGKSKKGIYVLLGCCIYRVDGGKIHDDVIDSSIDTTDESERFSFTSSIVRSLDNLSDVESNGLSDGNNTKKVTFM